jgi:carbamoyl-phosphate synthase small subunit
VTAERGFLLLEDGTRFDGESVGAPADVTGEVVFTTSMSGYQESVTDPSFARQLITFTVPHVGNYGVSARAMESDRIHAAGVIMRDATNDADAPGAEQGWLDWLGDHGIPAVAGVDTRALVRHLRDRGAMRGGIFDAGVAESEARERIAAEPSMIGRDLAREVTVAS